MVSLYATIAYKKNHKSNKNQTKKYSTKNYRTTASYNATIEAILHCLNAIGRLLISNAYINNSLDYLKIPIYKNEKLKDKSILQTTYQITNLQEDLDSYLLIKIL